MAELQTDAGIKRHQNVSEHLGFFVPVALILVMRLLRTVQ